MVSNSNKRASRPSTARRSARQWVKTGVLGVGALFLCFAGSSVNVARLYDDVALQRESGVQIEKEIGKLVAQGKYSSELITRGDPEARLVRALMRVSEGKIGNALRDIDQLLAETPNFRLAHLVKGDLLLAHAQPIHAFGALSDAPSLPVLDLRDEARVRYQRYVERLEAMEQVPSGLLQLAPEQRHAVVVDISRSRLFLYENVDGAPRLVNDFYVSIGKNGADKMREGDQRTPIGLYRVQSEVERSRLSDFYGSGAFPLDYPNAWDRRGKRGGSGIWIHGTPPDTYSRPPRASNGCVVLANRDIDALRPYLRAGTTPVLITRSAALQSPQEVIERREVFLETLEQWRRDWESLDTERYAAHYARNFSSEGKGYSAWIDQKRGTQANKAWLRVSLSNVSIIAYPERNDLIAVDFEQSYQSNNFTSAARKRQYWLREADAWRIVHEGEG